MLKRLKAPLLAICGVAPWPLHAADPLNHLQVALLGGTPALDLRLRWEVVDNESSANPLDADATTLRTRLSYTTGKWNDLDASVEMEDVSGLDKTTYNSTVNGMTTRPVIGDPVDTELNQAWLRYGGIPRTRIKAGRMRYLLDNQRFVGNAGWRQNEQTFDGASVLVTPLPGVELNFAEFFNVNTVFFTNVPLQAHLVNLSWSPAGWLKLAGYDYLLDFDGLNAARQDTQTYGLRAAGTVPLAGDFKLGYAAEAAHQTRYGEAPAIVDADYWLAELAPSWGPVQGKVGYEVLGSHDGTYGLQTPLATLHAFQGWADLFLATPPTGIQDRYASVSATCWQINAVLRGHLFRADDGGADYGDEIDASASRPLTRQLAVMAKYARYNADAFATDTEKFWLQAEFKF